MKKLFYNGTILTMEAEPSPEAVLICEDTIEAVGGLDLLRRSAPDAVPVNLEGRTLLPAFLDAHGHFSSYANAQLQVSLDEAASFDQIAARIASFLETNQIPAGQWVVAKGYDHNTLAERRQPELDFLDRIAPAHPLVLQHQSGHCGVLNSLALTALGITANTPSPPDGVIGRANGRLTGYLEEGAYIQCIKRVPMADLDALLQAYRKAQDRYLSYGITTVQEGMMVAQMLPLYQGLIDSGLLTVDVVGYSEFGSMKALSAAFPRSVQRYDRHFKIGGYKIFLDGSPQVKTAWMRTPYRGSDTCGYGTMSDAQVLSAVAAAAQEGMQLLAHCNGDAAAQQYLDAVEAVSAQRKRGITPSPVMIHAQLLATDQLAQVARLHVIPSFFIAHVLHWGDIHIQNFGFDRAQSISPAHSALGHGIPFTFHQDAPVIEPNMLETIQCAVTRKTRSGVLLGGGERIGALDALRAVTLHAAQQYAEADSKGSIRAGKQADFVLLSDNPLAVPGDQIADISVLETIKAGQTVFRHP